MARVRRTTARERTGENVSGWRIEKLAHAGFDRTLAGRLASDGRYDLHALLELVDQGCPPELAARILAPLDHEDAR